MKQAGKGRHSIAIVMRTELDDAWARWGVYEVVPRQPFALYPLCCFTPSRSQAGDIASFAQRMYQRGIKVGIAEGNRRARARHITKQDTED